MSFFESVVKGLPIIGDIAGGMMAARSAESAANKNADLQREFAKNSIRWRVADAKAAGIHPLAALGSQGISASPVYVGSGDAGLSAAGQDIGRAISAAATPAEKEDRLGIFMQQQLERQDTRDRLNRQEARADLKLASDLKNDEVQRQWYWAQIMNAGNDVKRPGIPDGKGKGDGIQGSVPPGAVKVVPRETESRNPNAPHVTAGDEGFWKTVETSPGVFRRHPNKSLDSELINAAIGVGAYVDRWNYEGGMRKLSKGLGIDDIGKPTKDRSPPKSIPYWQAPKW